MNYDEENSSGFIGSDFSGTGYDVDRTEALLCFEERFSQLYICPFAGKLYIIKGLKEAYRSQELYQLLRKEFRIGSELNHPNIARIISMEDLPDIGLCFKWNTSTAKH